MILTQYIPDIFKAVVARVNTRTNTGGDPYPVVFDHGHYAEVVKNLGFKDQAISDSEKVKYPLVWLVMDFEEQSGGHPMYYAQGQYQIIIAMPTDPNWGMDERATNNFKPRLLPIYALLMDELHKTQEFGFPSTDQLVKHTRILRPYWGGGQGQNGETGKGNLFNDFIDAIQIKNLSLNVVKKLC